ncbi:MAG: VWA domain-containing protein [Chloroflexota bacterium]
MTLTNPVALLLLVVILPVLVYYGWPRSRFRRLRDGLSLTLRTVIVLLLVLALAGAQVVQSADRLAVVYLVDASDSMGPLAQAAALDFIDSGLDAMGDDDLAGIVVFGEDAQVARTMSSTRELGPVRTTPDTGNTNLAAAVRLALALFPEGAARRIVVLSDGQPTIGNWESAAQLAAAAGVEISYVPYAPPPEPEIQVRSVDVPGSLDENQEFTMTVTIESETDTRAVVTVLAAGEIVSRNETALREGSNAYSLRLRSGTAGFRDFVVRAEPLNAAADTFNQNNQLAAFSRVEGVPRVLVVDGSAATANETRYIVPALQDAGLAVDVVAPNGLPVSVEGLAAYRSVVLVDTPATVLSNQRMDAIATYVSDLGGGLVVVGGPNAYGPGGYYQTPLEDVLPVEMQIRDQQRLPRLTIAYVIDRSGSMGAESASGIPHIDLAKEAIIRSIDFLQPDDRVAVASFDTSAYWIAEFQNVADRTALQQQVATLRPGGGTSIVAGVELIASTIVNEPTQIKHMILLTDGGAQAADLVELADDLNRGAGVTTSVISIGDFEAQFLQEMAEVGEGNYHNVPDADAIPSIFTLETVLATRTYIQEDTFTPTLTARHPIMQGINALPQLRGYVTTTPRGTAQIILRGPEPYRDPILAAWQYGLGRSVAFTSDATSRWSQEWVGWEGFASFWSQAVRWTITEGASANLDTRVLMQDTRAQVVVEARDNDGGFLNGLALEGSVVYSPEGTAQRVTLRQVAPGRYEATFTPQGEGAYFIRVGQAADDAASELVLNQTTGWVMSYSAEYDIRPEEGDIMETLADLTGGRNLTGTPVAAFDPVTEPQSARVPVWPWLLAVALALLPVDIAVRRLLITRSDLRRLRAWLGSKAARRAVRDEAAAERMTSLRAARDRARVATAAEDRDEATVSRLRDLRRPAMQEPPSSQPAGQMRFDAQPRVQPSQSTPRPDFKAGPGENIGARLLKRRRRDEDDAENDS